MKILHVFNTEIHFFVIFCLTTVIFCLTTLKHLVCIEVSQILQRNTIQSAIKCKETMKLETGKTPTITKIFVFQIFSKGYNLLLSKAFMHLTAGF